MSDRRSGADKTIMEAEERMGRFELLRPLGQGGMAEVFLARQSGISGFSKQLVIKRVLPGLVDDAKFVEMFLDEARLAARLSHPNICQVFELGEVDGQYFIAMEHVAGDTLTKLILQARDKKLAMPLAAAFRIVAQLCEALSYAHALKGEDGRPLKLVHRDVTPSNIMVTPEGSVKLLDFGIARAADRTHLTQVGVAKGKLGFMSPEQLRSPQDIDHRSDLFAVGAVMYTLLCGRTPYADVMKSSHAMRDMANGTFPAPREISPFLPEPVEALILKAMAADPNERFASASEFHRELEKVAMARSLSLGPHVLLEWMKELERDPAQRSTLKKLDEVAQRPTDKLPETRLPDRKATPDPDAAAAVTEKKRAAQTSTATSPSLVVNVDTGDVVKSDEITALPDEPRSKLPMVVLGVAAVTLLLVLLAILKFSQTPDELPMEPEPIAAEPVQPEPQPEPAKPELAQPEPAKPEPARVEVAVADPAPEAVAEPTKDPVEKPEPAPVKPEAVATKTPAPSKPKSLEITGPSGTLIVESTPRAKISVGNQVLGTTPLKRPMPVGSHRLKIDYGGTLHQLIISVSEGKETLVRDQAD